MNNFCKLVVSPLIIILRQCEEEEEEKLSIKNYTINNVHLKINVVSCSLCISL
jgi:hypothetical protein